MSNQPQEGSGWQSGPSIISEEVPAVDIWTDDVLILGDGTIADAYLVEYAGTLIIISWRERGGTRSGAMKATRGRKIRRVKR